MNESAMTTTATTPSVAEQEVFDRFVGAASAMLAVGMDFIRRSDPEKYTVLAAKLAGKGATPTLIVELEPALAVSLRLTGESSTGEPIEVEAWRYEAQAMACA